MRILVATHSFGHNGAAFILKVALNYWIKKLGWQIDVLVTPSMQQAWGAVFLEIGVRPILRTDSKINYKFVLINTIIDAPNIEQFFGKLPIVLWVHEGVSVVYNSTKLPIDWVRLFSKINVLIFDCEWQVAAVFRSFIHHLPEQRIKVVSCGVKSPDVIPIKQISPSNKLRLINIGSVYDRKRQTDLAAAVINLTKKIDIDCIFIGDLTDVSSFRVEVESLLTDYPGVLHWLGVVSEEKKYQALYGADIACFPSRDETFGISALEAALCRLPVVMADLPVYGYVGWVDGVNCLKYPVGDVVALQNKIEALSNNTELRLKIGEAGAALAKTYTLEKFYASITKAVLSFEASC